MALEAAEGGNIVLIIEREYWKLIAQKEIAIVSALVPRLEEPK